VREEHGLRRKSGGDCIERSGTSDQVRKNEIGRDYDTFVGYKRCMEVLARKSVRKIPLGRRKLGQEDITMDLHEFGLGRELD